MVRKCIVCKIPETTNSGVSFHSFPKEQGLRKAWMNECQIRLVLPSYRVCSKHFSPQHLKNGLVKKNVVPSVKSSFTITSQLDEHSVPGPSTQNSQTALESDSPASSSLKRTPARKRKIDSESSHSSPTSSPTRLIIKLRSFNAHNIGDLNVDHFCTPLRAETHLTMVKQKLSEKQIKVDKLKRQVISLQNKLNTYKDLIVSSKDDQLLSENAGSTSDSTSGSTSD